MAYEMLDSMVRHQDRLLDRYNHPENQPDKEKLKEYQLPRWLRYELTSSGLFPSPSVVRERNKRLPRTAA